MALIAAENNVKQFTIIKVGGLQKEDFKPHFYKLIRNEDGSYSNEGEYKSISGFITEKITFKTIGEGDLVRRAFEITLVDGEDTYKLQCGFNQVGTALLNSIAGTPNLGKLELALYQKDGYSKISVKNNGQRTDWALSVDEQKALIEVIKSGSGKVLKDSSGLEAKLEELIESKFNDTFTKKEVSNDGHAFPEAEENLLPF